MKVNSQSKILRLSDAIIRINQWKGAGDVIVFTNGVFDLFHRGHLLSLESAASFGDRLIVGVNSDNSVKTLDKGAGRPLNNETDRACLLAGLEVVDLVVIFEESTPYELLSVICPDVLVKGSDYEMEDIVGREFAKRIERIPLLKGYSTTTLIKKIKAMSI